MGNEPFRIRAAREEDLATLSAYAYAEGMGDIEATDGVTVAANEADEPVGFIRIVTDEAGVAHVNPVIVYPTWRGLNVGRALMEDASARYGELRLVSRGSSKPFYDALGFSPIGWESIKPEIAAECDDCELREECTPQPMTGTLPSTK